MYLIVGLGNMGDKYAKTYHNLGFLTIEYLAQYMNAPLKKHECKSITASFFSGEKKTIIAQPQTYMNLSGFAVSELKNKYKIPDQNILIIFDDIDLDKGEVRFRQSGSGGTHNGMRHVVELLGQDIARLRIGCGRPAPHMQLADFVLSRIPVEEQETFFLAIKQAAHRALEFLE